MHRIAIISAILEHPRESNHLFNDIIALHKDIVIGRMGIPLHEYDISVVSITVKGEVDEINNLTGKLGRIPGVQVKTSISKKEINA